MTFDSPQFLFYFLPIFLVGYHFFPNKNYIVLFFSLFLYYWGCGSFILLLLTSGVSSWILSQLMASKIKLVRATSLFLGIFVNVLIGIFYKYLIFILSKNSFSAPSIVFPLPAYLFPLGLKIFLFSASGYLLDVYRKKQDPSKNLAEVLLAISIFPMLIAGPMLNFKQIESWLSGAYKNSIARSEQSAKIFIIGLAQKVLISNTLLTPIEELSKIPHQELDLFGAVFLIFAYPLQVYYTLLGYTNMARGILLLIGFNPSPNFNLPFTANSVTDFWRRWNISLSEWLKQHVYIPLGGSRGGVMLWCFNIFASFMVGCLWYGFSASIIYFGLYQCLLILIERICSIYAHININIFLKKLYFFFFSALGWSLLVRDNLMSAFDFLKTLFGFGVLKSEIYNIGLYLQGDVVIALILGFLFSIYQIKTPDKKFIISGASRKIKYLNYFSFVNLLYVLIFIFSLSSIAIGDYRPSVYFQG